MGGLGEYGLVADDGSSQLCPFNDIAFAGITAFAIVVESHPPLVLLVSVRRVVGASQSGDDLIERVVGSLHTVGHLGGAMPPVDHGREGDADHDGHHRHDQDRGQKLDQREPCTPHFFRLPEFEFRELLSACSFHQSFTTVMLSFSPPKLSPPHFTVVRTV